MGGFFTQVLVVLGILHFQFMRQVNDETVKVSAELLRQHEEQRSREMALLQEVEQRSQEVPKTPQESLLLSACQCWWFWVSAEMLLMLFAFYWLPRKGNSGYDGSACGETPAVPRRKRRRRKKMHSMADYGDKLDQIRSPDVCLEWKDMQNSEEEMKGNNASAKPFPQETFGQSCIQGIH
ncbi:hypothetical protein DUI87_14073 [Hirundo rustica rustica]|uniref:Uncharacterized protein n=1 Tax=Hirundo rustica rustica TaxID=333673 RepID=A0A3M0K7D3_HIRRU|nr:hypothetical protein DUI87_14073 [Hirundo rustica rustica]